MSHTDIKKTALALSISDNDREILRDTWQSFNRRCNDPNIKNYHRYGGRGIKVFPEWRYSKDNPDAFNNFLLWVLSSDGIGVRPTGRYPSGMPFYSIDRINNDGNYEPGNLRWATAKEQVNNSSATNITEYKGVTYPSLTALCTELNLNYETVRLRISNLGMSLNEAVEKPIQDNSVVYKGVTYKNLTAFCIELDLNYNTVFGRLNRGMSLDEAVETPIQDNSVVYKGVTYTSLHTLCIELNLAYAVIWKRINNLGMSLNEAIEKPIRNDSVVYKGVTYPSLTALCTELNLAYAVIWKRINKDGMSLNEAVEKPSQDNSVVYKGVTYKNLTAFCIKLELNYNTVFGRLNRGMSLNEAVETPTNEQKYWIDDLNFGSLSYLASFYGFSTVYISNTVPKEKLIEYILKYREDRPEEFTAKGIKFKTKRLAKQLSTQTNKLFSYKLVGDSYKLTTEHNQIVSDTIRKIENHDTNGIETVLIESDVFTYGFAEAVLINVGNEKLYLVSHIDVKKQQ